MVLEEQPGKVSEAFRLFLQGQGYGKFTNLFPQIHCRTDKGACGDHDPLRKNPYYFLTKYLDPS